MCVYGWPTDYETFIIKYIKTFLANRKLETCSFTTLFASKFEGSVRRNVITFLSVYRIERKLAEVCRIGSFTTSLNMGYTIEVAIKLFNIFRAWSFFLPQSVYTQYIILYIQLYMCTVYSI